MAFPVAAMTVRMRRSVSIVFVAVGLLVGGCSDSDVDDITVTTPATDPDPNPTEPAPAETDSEVGSEAEVDGDGGVDGADPTDLTDFPDPANPDPEGGPEDEEGELGAVLTPEGYWLLPPTSSAVSDLDADGCVTVEATNTAGASGFIVAVVDFADETIEAISDSAVDAAGATQLTVCSPEATTAELVEVRLTPA